MSTETASDSSSLPQPPAVGLGTWKIPNADCAALVREAIAVGYRHLDCACDYGNEAEVGDGLASAMQAGLAKRDDVWVTSKLWNTFHRPEHVRPACERSLRDLKLDHLDLYHVHFPIALEYVDFDTRYPPGWTPSEDKAMQPVEVPLAETWQAMEELVDAGLVRQIGVCNFSVALLRELLLSARIRPTTLQVERHPYLTQAKLLRYCASESIHVTAFSPFGAPSYVPLGMAEAGDSVLADPVVTAIAQSHGCTPGQAVLAWGIQRGTSVIPKTQQPDRLRENLAAADLTLADDDLAAIDALDRHQRFNDPGVFCEAAFGRFYPIFD